MRMIAVVCSRLILAPIIFMVLFFSLEARAHQSPKGMAYSLECCSGYDCAPIHKDRVEATSSGWRVSVGPNDHPLVPEPTSFVIGYLDEKLRTSTDGDFHLCYSSFNGPLCIYVPPMGL